jgi:hypothetical protein
MDGEKAMRLNRNFLVAATLVAACAAYAAVPQGRASYQNPGQERRDDRDRPAYDDGYRQGRSDAMARRSPNNNGGRWHTGHERHAYQDGYNAGYQSVGPMRGDRDRDRDRDRDNHRDRDRDRDRGRGTYGGPQYGGYAGRSPWDQARQIGYQDGVADGRNDRATGHSFRPTQDDNYKNASRGHNSSMGDKQTYKNAYREGYARGYPEGYNGRR